MPRLTIVIGGNGSGKTTWKDDNRSRLPKHYYDTDSVAKSFGDWNDEDYLHDAQKAVANRIEERLKNREDFGFESTYSGRRKPEIVERAQKSGYEVTCIFIGTEHPRTNMERVANRAKAKTGHSVPEATIKHSWKTSQENLAKTFHLMDNVEIINNTRNRTETVLKIRNRQIIHKASPMPKWADALANRLNTRPD